MGKLVPVGRKPRKKNAQTGSYELLHIPEPLGVTAEKNTASIYYKPSIEFGLLILICFTFSSFT